MGNNDNFTIELMRLLFTILLFPLMSYGQMIPIAQKFAIYEKGTGSYTMRGKDMLAIWHEGLASSITGTDLGNSTVNIISHVRGWYPLIGNSLTSQSYSFYPAPATLPITWTGSPTANDGYVTLNGTSQYAGGIGNNYNITTGDFSIAYWFNAPASNQFAPIVCKRENSGSFNNWATGIGSVNSSGSGISSKTVYMVGVGASGSSGRQSVHTNSNYADGTWHHVVVTRNSSGLLIYIDGSSVAITVDNAGTSSMTYSNTGNFFLGFNNGASFFNGSFCDVVIFDYCMSSTDVTAWYHKMTGR